MLFRSGTHHPCPRIYTATLPPLFLAEATVWHSGILDTQRACEENNLVGLSGGELYRPRIRKPHYVSGFENLMGLFGYSLQIYADFSGYTDIATGVAMLMGFYLPINFNSPYKATNAGEFWKRWHISLSKWLQTYLYIPLGGNRKITATL